MRCVLSSLNQRGRPRNLREHAETYMESWGGGKVPSEVSPVPKFFVSEEEQGKTAVCGGGMTRSASSCKGELKNTEEVGERIRTCSKGAKTRPRIDKKEVRKGGGSTHEPSLKRKGLALN